MIRTRIKVRRPIRRGLVTVRRAQRRVTREYIPDNIAWIRTRVGRLGTQGPEGLAPEAARHAGRNFRLGVLNGMMFALVDALLAPSFVLALFINRLGGPNVLVGLAVAVYTGGGLLPQILVAGKVQGRTRVLGWYRRTALIRTLCILVLAILTPFLAAYPLAMLAALFVLYGGYSFGAGISSLPWFELIAKTISPRRRGTFFSMRNFWGGVLALLSSGLISAVLSERISGLTFPNNFALLFAISSVVIAIGFAAMSLLKEPASTQTSPPFSFAQALRQGAAAYRANRDYHAFMNARVLLGLATIADPFYVVFARDALHAPVATVGLYLGASAISSLLSNFLWGPLADRAGNRTLMVLSVLATSVVPLSALLIATFAGMLPVDILGTIFSVVFILGGLALGASRVVNSNMMLSIAPPASRAIYLGFLNTILGLVTFIAVVGGIVVDTLGFTVLFLLALVLAGTALLASARMSQGRAY